MTDINWVKLTDAEQGQLVNIWMLAAEKKGQIINDQGSIKILCHLTDEPNINKFIELGFIDQPDSYDSHRYTTGTPPVTSGCIRGEENRIEKKIKNIGHSRSNDPRSNDPNDLKAKTRRKSNGSGLERFPDFWDAWPRKVKRKDSEKVWKSKKLDDHADVIIAAVPIYIEFLKNQKNTKGFDQDCAHPPTWLRGDRWKDELSIEKKNEMSYDEWWLKQFLKDPIGSNEGNIETARRAARELNSMCHDTVMDIVGHELDETLNSWNEELKQWKS